ncbi:MAG: Ppx/GppA family phosphatase [Zetaproteobacteria bacterium]|nr:Ppx/GppA family phosphatase [Zetaproteobacteria bacterium]
MDHDQRFASIDIGSNTMRLRIADQHPDHPIGQQIFYTHQVTRLGEGVRQNGRLSEAAIIRARQCLRDFRQHLDEHQTPLSHLRAVATAALRLSDNASELCQQVEDETGITIHIIDGDTEARLSLLGATSALDPAIAQAMLLFDIGGGSTEFIQVKAQQLVQAISQPLGVVHTYRHAQSDPISPPDYQAMVDDALHYLHSLGTSWLEKPANHLVGTAGTITTLAATYLNLNTYDVNQINNCYIALTDFYNLRDRLLQKSNAERLVMPTIEKGREDLIVAGLAITEAVLTFWQFDHLISVDAGLLEGNWIEWSHHQSLQHI